MRRIVFSFVAPLLLCATAILAYPPRGWDQSDTVAASYASTHIKAKGGGTCNGPNPPAHCPPPVVEEPQMGRLWTAGAETKDISNTNGQALLEGTMGTSAQGSISIDTTTKRSGVASYQFNTGGVGSGTAHISLVWTGATNGRNYFARGYVRFPSSLGLAATSVMSLYSSGDSGPQVFWDPVASTLQLRDSNSTAIGNSVIISLNTWYRIELRFKYNADATTEVEFRLDGVSIASQTAGLGNGPPTKLIFGWVDTVLVGSDLINFDDIAVNDDQGTSQNTWPGDGHIVLLLPTSDNSAGSWKAGSAGSASANGALFNGIDNTPPVGAASAMAVTAGISNNVSGATNPNGDFNMTTYAAAGVPDGARINVLQQVIVHGEDVATSTKTGTFTIVSNPAQGSTTNVADGATAVFGPAGSGAVGTYPTNWIAQRGPALYDLVVVRATAPVARITKVDTGTRAADVCFMGILVDYSDAPFLARLPGSPSQYARLRR